MTEQVQGVLEVNRHDPRIVRKLRRAPRYTKQGEVDAQIAQGGEQITTRLANGTVETTNTAKPGDAIVTNPGGEQYIIGAAKFESRYEPKPGQEGKFRAKGQIRATRNPWRKPITMKASWGEMQNGAGDAMLADTLDPKTQELGGEPYIIGRSEFRQTYRANNPLRRLFSR